MEVYKITCKTTHKIYIGSSKYSKEYRWSGSGFSHLSCMENGDTAPLYEDMRKYGPNDFELDTLEILNEGSQHDIQLLEDKWIKYYWDTFGEDKLYNRMRSAFASSNRPGPSKEQLAKRNKTMMTKYGTLYYVGSDARHQCYLTNLKNKTGIFSDQALRNRSNKYIFDNKEFYGITNLHKYMISKGYDLTYSQVHHWSASGGKDLSKSTLSKYPELLDSVQVIRNWRSVEPSNEVTNDE